MFYLTSCLLSTYLEKKTIYSIPLLYGQHFKLLVFLNYDYSFQTFIIHKFSSACPILQTVNYLALKKKGD